MVGTFPIDVIIQFKGIDQGSEDCWADLRTLPQYSTDHAADIYPTQVAILAESRAEGSKDHFTILVIRTHQECCAGVVIWWNVHEFTIGVAGWPPAHGPDMILQ